MRHTHERKESMLRDIAGEFVARTANRTSLITITRVIVNDENHTADIMVSVLPDNQENAVCDFLNRHIDEFKEFVTVRMRIGRFPHFTFKPDIGDANRQRVEELI